MQPPIPGSTLGISTYGSRAYYKDGSAASGLELGRWRDFIFYVNVNSIYFDTGRVTIEVPLKLSSYINSNSVGTALGMTS
jgi:hypothetical protein